MWLSDRFLWNVCDEPCSKLPVTTTKQADMSSRWLYFSLSTLSCAACGFTPNNYRRFKRTTNYGKQRVGCKEQNFARILNWPPMPQPDRRVDIPNRSYITNLFSVGCFLNSGKPVRRSVSLSKSDGCTQVFLIGTGIYEKNPHAQKDIKVRDRKNNFCAYGRKLLLPTEKDKK